MEYILFHTHIKKYKQYKIIGRSYKKSIVCL